MTTIIYKNEFQQEVPNYGLVKFSIWQSADDGYYLAKVRILDAHYHTLSPANQRDDYGIEIRQDSNVILYKDMIRLINDLKTKYNIEKLNPDA